MKCFNLLEGLLFPISLVFPKLPFHFAMNPRGEFAPRDYSQFSPEWTSCHPSEPSIFSKMVMIWQQSWTAKSDYSRKYSDVILQTLIRDPPKGCKRLKKKKKWRPRNFFTQQSITDISADKNKTKTTSSQMFHLIWSTWVKLSKLRNLTILTEN